MHILENMIELNIQHNSILMKNYERIFDRIKYLIMLKSNDFKNLFSYFEVSGVFLDITEVFDRVWDDDRNI